MKIENIIDHDNHFWPFKVIQMFAKELFQYQYFLNYRKTF